MSLFRLYIWFTIFRSCNKALSRDMFLSKFFLFTYLICVHDLQKINLGILLRPEMGKQVVGLY